MFRSRSTLSLLLMSFALFGCGGGSGGSGVSSPPPPTSKGPIRTEIMTTPGSADLKVIVLLESTNSEALSLTYQSDSHLLKWTDTSGSWTDPNPVATATIASPNFFDFLRDTATVGWYYATSGQGISNQSLQQSLNISHHDSPLIASLRGSTNSTPPASCPQYVFRGDNKCSAPLDLSCGRCDPTSACQVHDTCYFNLPDSACSSPGNDNSAKYACDQALGVGVSQICGSSCGEVYSAAVRWGGGRGWNPTTPCNGQASSAVMGINYCGHYGEASCCQSVRTDQKCNGNGSGFADCACTECWKVFPPAISFSSVGCKSEGANPDGSTRYHVMAQGQAQGPVGLTFQIGGDYHPGGVSFTRCSDWSSSVSSSGGGNCLRDPGQSASSSWSRDGVFDFIGISTFDVTALVSLGSDQLAAATTSLLCAVGKSALTIAKPGTGVGTVTSYPQGISCGTTCAETFLQGSHVILTAAPDPGSVFSGWSGAGCTGTGVCDVLMNSAMNVTALFVCDPLECGVFAISSSGSHTATPCVGAFSWANTGVYQVSPGMTLGAIEADQCAALTNSCSNYGPCTGQCSLQVQSRTNFTVSGNWTSQCQGVTMSEQVTSVYQHQ